ncbi:hypothetical protein IW262DRAFT_1295892 [Armillaria fumosa]|nr:hypothetical protein IW262DRAFT_1295892 [Armillaria fumosa]
MPPSSTARTRTPRELLSTITPSLAHLAVMSLPAAPAVSNAVPTTQLFPSSDLPPSSTPQLPYPLVASLTASAVAARLGQMTALQSNPAALMETSLIQAGLNPPPPFPLYSGPSTPEVQTHANSTSAQRAQHLRSRHAEFANNLTVGCNSRSGPSITRLKLLLCPVACGNNAHPPQHIDPSIHADDPHPWNFQILQEDIGPMDRQFECIGLVINMIVHDGLLSFSDFHRAIAQHQALPESPKIPGFNSDPDASYLTSGWCLQQMRCVRNQTSLRCCEKAYKTGAYWCLQTLTAYASMAKAPVDSGGHSDPTLKHVFIIAPTYGNIVHGIEKCYADDFQTPIDLAKACLPHPCFPARAMFGLAFLPCTLQNSYQAEEEQCLRLCHGEDPNLVPSMSSQFPLETEPHGRRSYFFSNIPPLQEENHDEVMVVDNDDDKENQPPGMAQPSHPPFVPTHVPRPPPPFSAPRWDYPGQDLLGIVKQRVSPSRKLQIHAKDVGEAADVFWHVLLHIGSIMHKLPPGEVIDPSRHSEPVLPPRASVTNWQWPEAFLDGTIIQRGQGVGQSIYASVLAVNLMKIIDTTDPNCQFSRLPNNSLLVSLRFPIPDLTSDQAADPAMGELMLPWLDLGKTQAVTADPDGKDCLKEPVPQFLMDYCSDILSVSGNPLESLSTFFNLFLLLRPAARSGIRTASGSFFDALAAYHALHTGFHQLFGIEFGSLARGPTLPSMIKDTCERKEKMALEFIYWWFDNRLERVEQLIPHLEYDIGPIVNTPQNNLSFARGEAETLAHRVSRAFQNALKEYLRVNVKERGKQLLLAMTASPYLPANPDKKLKFQFRLLNDDVRMDVPTTKSLWSFVHGCFQTIDIGYDGVLASLLANGSWRGITVDSYLQGIFMGDVTSFNAQ